MEQFAQRAIDVQITPGKGSGGEKPGTPVKLEGYRVIVSTEIYTGQFQGRMQCAIYGLPLTLINEMTRIGPLTFENVKTNAIEVYAGSKGGAMTLAYSGQIWTSYGDFSAVPEVPLVISAQGSLTEAVKPVSPSSFKGAMDVATAAQSIASGMNLSFRNDGVHIILKDPYLHGTSINQLNLLAAAAQFYYSIKSGTMTIWPKGQPRSGDPISVSPAEGLVSYPAFTNQGMVLTTLFNPNFEPGLKVNVTSSVTPACGIWSIYSVSHQIASEMPNGPWFSQIGVQRVSQ